MKLKALIELTRIEHAFMLSIAVLIGEILVGLPSEEVIALSVLCPFFIEIASFAINDYFDLETDKINKRKDRPLVRGEMKPKTALAISLISFAFGIACSFFINQICFQIALGFAIVAFFYSWKLKDLPLVGNTYIAASMSIPFVFGNLASATQVSNTIVVLSTITFLTGLAREICKTVQDVEGDVLARKAKTLPVLIGKRNSLMIASLLYVFAILSSFYPFIFLTPFTNNPKYLLPILLADALLIYVAIKIFSKQDSDFLKKCRTISLIALGIGLFGFLLGSI